MIFKAGDVEKEGKTLKNSGLHPASHRRGFTSKSCQRRHVVFDKPGLNLYVRCDLSMLSISMR